MAETMQRLRLRQLDRSLLPWKSLGPRPREGWIRTIRRALGMTVGDLGRRVGVSAPAVSQFEKAEREYTITLSRLKALAEALDCDLVYAFVPHTSLQAFLKREGERIARQRVQRVQHSMSLEAQEVSEEEIKNQIREQTEEILEGNWRRIWKKS